jgi:hypothetical protein
MMDTNRRCRIRKVTSQLEKVRPCGGRTVYSVPVPQTLLYCEGNSHLSILRYIQVDPELVLTKTLLVPLDTTPTKMRGVGDPLAPDEGSNVTQATPILSLL